VPDERALREVVASRKKELAFSLGGMGSVSTNFYNQAYSRQGWPRRRPRSRPAGRRVTVTARRSW
jgi:hypothetical protein